MCSAYAQNHRILVIDDNRAIHEDLRKVLSPRVAELELLGAEELLFGEPTPVGATVPPETFELESAFQGQDGIDMVTAAVRAGQPFALAIVDMRMPPGIGGLETIEAIFAIDPHIQVVICTAYSDSSWEEILARFGHTDRLLILRKPFDAAEVCQLASALTEKWRLAQDAVQQRQGLARSLALAQAVQNAVLDGILVIDEERRVVSYNRKFCELWRVPDELAAQGDDGALLGHVLGNLVDPDEFLRRVNHLYEHPFEEARDEITLKDGRYFDRWSGPVLGEQGHHGRIWCFRDVTPQRKIERERAIITERMASIGRLAAGVGHEINNPLAFALGNVEILTSLLEEANFAQEDLRHDASSAVEAARVGLDRIRVIVRDLQTLSRSDDETMASVDVEAVLEQSIQIANSQLRHRARLVREYEPAPPVLGNATRLGQVFLNLLVNAAQAIPEGRVKENTIRVRLSAAEGSVKVEISDSGAGIEEAHLSRIFDPFFTTKAVGEGTGLGLSICRGILDAHGGTIGAESVLGAGTTFRVQLPVGQARAAPRIVASPASVSRNRARILVVDDEPRIREVVARMLSAHQIVCESSGKGALSRIEAGERFDVILCDVMMPELTGMDVHREISRHDPTLASRLVFMTGGTFTETAQAYFGSLPNVRVEKPFGKVALVEAIDQVLAAA